MDPTELTAMHVLPGRFLLQIAQLANIQARGNDERSTAFIKGELRFGIGAEEGKDENYPAWASAELARVGLISGGVLAEPDERTQQSETGRISIYNGQASAGRVTARDDVLQLDIVAAVEMLYERLQYLQLLDILAGRRELTDQRGEGMRLTLAGRLTPIEQRKYENEFAYFTGTLLVQSTSDSASAIETIEVNIEEQPVYRVGESAGRLEGQLERKTIALQPIIFADHERGTNTETDHDIDLTLASFQARLLRANLLWNPGCVWFTTASTNPVVIVNSALRVSDNIVDIALSTFLDAAGMPVFTAGSVEPTNIVEVFLVRNELAGVKGGDTLSPGSGLDKVVISDGLVGHNNPQLLAHELGHVVNLLHTNAVLSAFTSGTPGSVGSLMEQITALGQDHLSINTQANCLAADNPAKTQSQPPSVCTNIAQSWNV